MAGPRSLELEVRLHFSAAIPNVAAVYDRRFYGMCEEKPAVIDRRYSEKTSVHVTEHS